MDVHLAKLKRKELKLLILKSCGEQVLFYGSIFKEMKRKSTRTGRILKVSNFVNENFLQFGFW